MPLDKPASLAIRVQCTGTVTEAALAQLESLLETHSEDIDLRFARATMLEELGRLTAARGAYKGVLARDGKHFGALMNLGTLLYVNGRIPEARILYQHAVNYHPREVSARVNLATVLTETDAAAARAAYEAALELDPAHATANYGLALLLEAQGDAESARSYRRRAFAEPIVHVAPYRGPGEPVRVLALLAASGGNLVTTLILDDRYIQATSLVADSYREGMELPPHDVILNAIGDAERSDDALEIAERIVAASNAGVINQPAAVRRTARHAVGRLGSVPNVRAPHTELLPREAITEASLAARGYTFPLLLRSPGHHMGEHFALVAAPDRLEHELAAMPGRELLVIEYLDAFVGGQPARKYRAFLIDGNVYPGHLAISRRWKVHYYTSDMLADDRHWAAEREYLTDMPAVVGPRVMTALAGIANVLALDYAGIDFSIDADGNVLVFEANATMAVYWPEDDERGAYRRPPIARVLAATKELFVKRAAQRRS
jgi:glutathione synthase/RimK-type ligase-like ATP-grasp enzyme